MSLETFRRGQQPAWCRCTVAVAVLLFLAAGVAQVRASEWLDDLGQAKAQARAERRPLLLLFVLEGCPECARMARNLADPRVQRALDPFVKVRLEFYEHRDVALRYGIEYTPTLLIYLPTDNFSSCRVRRVGALSPSSLVRLAQQIMQECGRAPSSSAEEGKQGPRQVMTTATPVPRSTSWQSLQSYFRAPAETATRCPQPSLSDVYQSAASPTPEAKKTKRIQKRRR